MRSLWWESRQAGRPSPRDFFFVCFTLAVMHWDNGRVKLNLFVWWEDYPFVHSTPTPLGWYSHDKFRSKHFSWTFLLLSVLHQAACILTKSVECDILHIIIHPIRTVENIFYIYKMYQLFWPWSCTNLYAFWKLVGQRNKLDWLKIWTDLIYQSFKIVKILPFYSKKSSHSFNTA